MKKSKIYSFFRKKYNVNLFHKPDNTENDFFYYTILENKVRLKFKVFDNIIVFDEIMQITSEYLNNWLTELADFFITQNEYTILVSKLGCIYGFDNICENKKAPIIENTHYQSISEKAYLRFTKYYNYNTSMYGFYILNVIEYKGDVHTINEIETYNKLDQVNNRLDSNSISNKFDTLLNSKYDNVSITEDKLKRGLLYSIDGIELVVSFKETSIDIIDIKTSNDVSMIHIDDLLKLFETLEDIDINIIKVSSDYVFNICKIRQYPKLNVDKKYINGYTGLGSFKIKKYERVDNRC